MRNSNDKQHLEQFTKTYKKLQHLVIFKCIGDMKITKMHYRVVINKDINELRKSRSER